MLDREGEVLDLQEVLTPEQAIEIDTQRMCRQLRIQARAQSAKRVGMVLLDVELLRQLPVYRLDDLSHAVEGLPHHGRQLQALVAPRQGQQPHALLAPQPRLLL